MTKRVAQKNTAKSILHKLKEPSERIGKAAKKVKINKNAAIKATKDLSKKKILKEENSNDENLLRSNDSNTIEDKEMERKALKNARTLYLRFKDTFPSSEGEIASLHPDIKHVRLERQSRKKNSRSYRYAYVEFESEIKAIAAKKDFASNKMSLYVDFVGDKSKGFKSKMALSSSKTKDKSFIHPTRLFVTGIGPGVSENVIRSLFPKSSSVLIPKDKKGSGNAFVQFANDKDAKSAFEASQNLSVDGHHLTVLYARKKKRNRDSKIDKTKKETPHSNNHDEEDDEENTKDQDIENDDDEMDEENDEIENDEEEEEENDEIENDEEDEENENDGEDEENEIENDEEEEEENEIESEEEDEENENEDDEENDEIENKEEEKDEIENDNESSDEEDVSEEDKSVVAQKMTTKSQPHDRKSHFKNQSKRGKKRFQNGKFKK